MKFFNTTQVALVGAGLILLSCIAVFSSAAKSSITYSDSIYPVDFSDDRVLVGASDNVFVGEVLEESGTKDTEIGVETQFKVRVLKNIKGELPEEITLDQLGGYSNGVLHVIDVEPGNEEAAKEYMLQPGQTYILATRVNKEQNWHTLISYPSAKSRITEIADKSEESFSSNERVQTLSAAYLHEVPFAFDRAAKEKVEQTNSVKDEPTI